VMDSADRTRSELQKLVADQVHKTVDGLNLATKDDLQQVEKKIDQLLAKHPKES